MMALWQIAKKELLLIARDRRALVVMLVCPLLFIAIIGISTGQLLSGENDSQRVKIGIVNDNRTLDENDVAGERLVEAFRSETGFAAREFDSLADAEAALSANEIRILVHIGAEFSTRIDELKLSSLMDTSIGPLSGGLSALDISVRGRAAIDAMLPLVREVVFALTLQTVSPIVAESDNRAKTILRIARKRAERERAESPSTSEGDASGLDSDSGDTSDDGTNSNGTNGEEGGGVYQEIVPGYTVLFVFFIVNLMARSFIQEREFGTFRRLMLAPISRMSLFLGKSLPFLIISVLQTIFLFVAGRLLFGMNWGSDPVALLALICVSSLTAVSLGLLIACVVRTDSQVTTYATWVIILMGGLSGCLFPRDLLPETMRTWSLVTPQAWCLIAYDQLLHSDQPNYDILARCCGVLLLFALGFFTCSLFAFRPERS